MSTAASAATLPIGNRFRRSPGWWGMIWTIATEAALFAYLFFSYYYLAAQFRGPWPPQGFEPFTLAIPMTVILVSSSFVMWWAEKGIKQGNQMRLRLGLLLVFLMGIAFAILEGIEWSQKRFTPSSDVYGSLFFTITGFHLTHVTVGLIMILVLQIWAWMGTFTEERHLAVTNVAMYWHFVDTVWLVVFSSFYIAPHLG